jgi:hypothetical protein
MSLQLQNQEDLSMNSLLGIWLFTSIFYQGAVRPPPNPDLKIYYTFQSESQNELYYYRTNESGFCRRWADYKINQGNLIQNVTATDVDNNNECSLDTDMQMGNHSEVHFEIINDDLHLFLQLGEEEIRYIFKKTN